MLAASSAITAADRSGPRSWTSSISTTGSGARAVVVALVQGGRVVDQVGEVLLAAVDGDHDGDLVVAGTVTR